MSKGAMSKYISTLLVSLIKRASICILIFLKKIAPASTPPPARHKHRQPQPNLPKPTTPQTHKPAPNGSQVAVRQPQWSEQTTRGRLDQRLPPWRRRRRRRRPSVLRPPLPATNQSGAGRARAGGGRPSPPCWPPRPPDHPPMSSCRPWSRLCCLPPPGVEPGAGS